VEFLAAPSCLGPADLVASLLHVLVATCFHGKKHVNLTIKLTPKKIQNTRQNMEEAKNNIAVFTVKKKSSPLAPDLGMT
jgi:hypothetical protein